MIKNQLDTPILITGIPRSGSSMIAGILHICGVFGGKISSKNKDIKKSTFENNSILKEIVTPYMNFVQADPLGQFPLPDTSSLPIIPTWKNNVQDIIINEGYTGGSWMYKGSQMSLMYPVWNYAFPNAKWIIVRRRDDDIVQSCLQTAYMKAFNSEENINLIGAVDKKDAWYWWVRQHNRRFAQMVESGLNCKQIHPERMVKGDYSQIHEMLEWLGLKWDSEIINYIEPKLWNVRKNL